MIEYEKYKPGILTGPCINVGFEWELLLLPVYVICQIDYEPTIDKNDYDEAYVVFINITSLVWIGLLLKYEYLLHQETTYLV